MSGIIMPFVGETHRNAIAVVRPEFFDEPVVQLSGPFAREKFDDLLSPDRKFGAISPLRVDGVSERDFSRIARIPGVLCQTDLLGRSLASKRRERGTSCCVG